MTTNPPFCVHFDLGTVPEKGTELKLVPSEAERAAIADWLGVIALPSLIASVRLSRRGKDFYGYEASFEADVVQACVVTLEPVPGHLTGSFDRSFRIVSSMASKRMEEGPGGEISLSDAEDPDVVEGTNIDLAEPVLEELSLVLDPYPRAPGATFEVPGAGEIPADSPFAVLKALKDKGGATTPPGAPAKPRRKT